MTITFDLGKEANIFVTADPYSSRITSPPTWRGRATVTFFIDPESGQGGGLGEVNLECEDAEALRNALREAAERLDDLITAHKEDVEDVAAHSVRCDICGCYSDSRQPSEWGHADGKGYVCFGDGTRVMYRRRVIAYAEDGDVLWREVPFESLSPGMRFGVKNPVVSEEEGVEFLVVEAPRSYYDGHRGMPGVRFRASP